MDWKKIMKTIKCILEHYKKENKIVKISKTLRTIWVLEEWEDEEYIVLLRIRLHKDMSISITDWLGLTMFVGLEEAIDIVREMLYPYPFRDGKVEIPKECKKFLEN